MNVKSPDKIVIVFQHHADWFLLGVGVRKWNEKRIRHFCSMQHYSPWRHTTKDQLLSCCPPPPPLFLSHFYLQFIILNLPFHFEALTTVVLNPWATKMLVRDGYILDSSFWAYCGSNWMACLQVALETWGIMCAARASHQCGNYGQSVSRATSAKSGPTEWIDRKSVV